MFVNSVVVGFDYLVPFHEKIASPILGAVVLFVLVVMFLRWMRRKVRPVSNLKEDE